MAEETKEEYIARHRQELGMTSVSETTEAPAGKKPLTLKERLNTFFFLILFALFLWVLFQMFGMMRSN